MNDRKQTAPLKLVCVWSLALLLSLGSWYGVIRLGLWLFSGVSMWSFGFIGGCVVLLALLAAYVPTVYIRKTNRILKALEQIAANTADLPQAYIADAPARRTRAVM